jgi:alanine-synthesizing transaminase
MGAARGAGSPAELWSNYRFHLDAPGRVALKTVQKSAKLANVLYDIRGPIMDAARQMEEEGHKIIKLNIGNLAVFGFDAPEEDPAGHDPQPAGNSAGYSDSKGIFAARKAVMHYTQQQGIKGVTLDDIYLGNGASELIAMATNALLNDGDELLLPSPDYPLWTAATSLSGGTPVHYMLRRGQRLDARPRRHPPQDHAAHQGHRGHQPEQPDRRAVFRRPAAEHRRHRAPARPGDLRRRGLRQGAVRRREAHRHRQPVDDVLTLTFNSLSKSYRSCGYRAGWLVVSGDKKRRADYIEGLTMLSNMRLCANVPGQYAIQTALGGYQSINDLVAPAGACGASATWPTN